MDQIIKAQGEPAIVDANATEETTAHPQNQSRKKSLLLIFAETCRFLAVLAVLAGIVGMVIGTVNRDLAVASVSLLEAGFGYVLLRGLAELIKLGLSLQQDLRKVLDRLDGSSEPPAE